MPLRGQSDSGPKKLLAAGAALTLVAALAACSSSSKSSSPTTVSSATSAPSTGATTGSTTPGGGSGSSLPASGPGSGTGTVKVGVQCAPGGLAAEPECLSTFNALAAYANANGGINGYKISIDQCDISTAQSNPSVSGTCGTKQVTADGIDVMVANNGGLGLASVLNAHNIPDISPIDVESDYDTSPISFPIYAWNTGGWTALAQYLAGAGFKHPAFTNPQSQLGAESIGAITAAYQKLGLPLKQVNASLTAVSFQPQVEALQSEGVDSVFPVLSDPGIAAMVQESNAIGYHPAWATIWDTIDQRIEKLLGPLGSSNKLYADAPFKSYAEAGQLEQSTVQKYAPGQSWEFSFISINNWIGMEILFQALEKMSGPATPAKILQQLKTGSFTSEWLPHPVSWTNTTGPLCRLTNTSTYIFKMESGVWTQIGGLINAQPQAVTGCKS